MSYLPEIARCLRRLLATGALLPALLANGSKAGLPPDDSPANALLVTNMAQFWVLPAAARSQPQHARLELLIYYCDTNWNVYWGQSDGLLSFLPLRNTPIRFKPGQKVLLDGPVLQVNQEFVWNKTTCQILSESNLLAATSAVGRLKNIASFTSHFVELEALVDLIPPTTPSAQPLSLVTEGWQINAFVCKDAPGERQPDLLGHRVRIRGVFAPRFDSFGKIVSIALWTPGWNQIDDLGTLATDPRFATPVTTSKKLKLADAGALTHVTGTVRRQQPGETVTIWDDTGQIRIFTKQQQPLQFGDAIEAIGEADSQGYDQTLQNALFRTASLPATDTNSAGKVWHLADQIRGLDQESIAQHPPVNLEGEVTMVDPQTNYIYLQDSSGGVRVMCHRFVTGRRIQPGMLVELDGVVALGDYTPVVTNTVIRQTGTLALPVAPLISFEEADTGTEDGHWIQMRGYVRKATLTQDWLDLELVTRRGEFMAHMPTNDVAQAPVGSLVLVRGVCVVVANARRQLTGLEIWSVVPGSVQTEQLAPQDLFVLPQRSMASLRQFSLFNTLSERVRTVGTVTLQVPGRYLYLQDGENSLFALSSQTDLLAPGDRVEIVGFPGNDGGKFLLRETACRRVASGPEPAPVRLPMHQSASEDLDGILVRAQGTLLDIVTTASDIRLVLQVNGRIVEARLDQSMPHDIQLAIGSQVAVTGVYRIQRDEYGKPSSFLLNLRAEQDLRLLSPPPWWTLRRLLLTMVGSLPVFLLALFWAVQTRRKNQELQLAQVELKTAHARLEERVAERTRELHAEVEAKQGALKRLSDAQQRLILASRQAGMAEVATGVLHNVGNILNSVNVSASMIGNSLEHLRIGKFVQAARLLNQPSGHLAAFLAEDARGRHLPRYFQQLAANMALNEQSLQAEFQALIKQIDHVKAVVAWQQGAARNSGFYENVNPADLMEDAMAINRGAYERHGIEVIRQFAPLASMVADRHKILQILINLLSNAKQALAVAPVAPKQVVLRIRQPDPGHVRFEVADNGVGIPPENLERIFSMGFTTKPNGHGFGLHSGANSATEMGGRLFATSAGTAQGATLVLELPVNLKPDPEPSPPPSAPLT